ncbi:MAG: hypothetical protein WBG86_10720, partial [Polyangiales bacterium]
MQLTPSSALFIGEESLLIQCANAWRERNHAITAIVTRAPQIAGWAAQQGIRVVAPGPGLVDDLADADFDYLFSIANLSILPVELVAKAKEKSVNFHDGPLPEYAGMYS